MALAETGPTSHIAEITGSSHEPAQFLRWVPTLNSAEGDGLRALPLPPNQHLTLDLPGLPPPATAGSGDGERQREARQGLDTPLG